MCPAERIFRKCYVGELYYNLLPQTNFGSYLATDNNLRFTWRPDLHAFRSTGAAASAMYRLRWLPCIGLLWLSLLPSYYEYMGIPALGIGSQQLRGESSVFVMTCQTFRPCIDHDRRLRRQSRQSWRSTSDSIKTGCTISGGKAVRTPLLLISI